MVKYQFGKSPQEAVAINSIVACFNLGGRLLLSFISDKVGRKTIFLCTLGFQIVISAMLPTVFNTQAYPVFVFLLCLLTACYGGGFGVIPAFLADMFGAQNVGATHGIILTTWSLGGVVGALVVNTIVNHNVELAGDKYALWIYNVNFIWMCVIITIGLITTSFLCTRLQDRWLPQMNGEVLRIRLWRWLVVWKKPCVLSALDGKEELLLWKSFLGNVV
jgi:MFS family permease